MPHRGDFPIVPTSLCLDYHHIQTSRWFHALLQASAGAVRVSIEILSWHHSHTGCLASPLHRLQNHQTRPRNPARYSLVFNPCLRPLKFVLPRSASVIKWFVRLSGGMKETWHDAWFPNLHPDFLGNSSSRQGYTEIGRKLWLTEKEAVLQISCCVTGISLPHATRPSHVFLVHVSEPWLSQLVVSCSLVPCLREVGEAPGVRFPSLSAPCCGRLIPRTREFWKFWVGGFLASPAHQKNVSGVTFRRFSVYIEITEPCLLGVPPVKEVWERLY